MHARVKELKKLESRARWNPWFYFCRPRALLHHPALRRWTQAATASASLGECGGPGPRRRCQRAALLPAAHCSPRSSAAQAARHGGVHPAGVGPGVAESRRGGPGPSDRAGQHLGRAVRLAAHLPRGPRGPSPPSCGVPGCGRRGPRYPLPFPSRAGSLGVLLAGGFVPPGTGREKEAALIDSCGRPACSGIPSCQGPLSLRAWPDGGGRVAPPATRLCIGYSARPVPPSALGGCGPRLWRRAPAHPPPRRSPRPLPPFRPRAGERRAGRGGVGGGWEREHRVATPPEPAFSRAAAGGSPLAPRSPPVRAQLRPSLRSASATPLSELRRSQRESAPSAPPPRLPAPRSPLLALRPGEAASQENPRNLCKKLTMKFKKFFDFGAIFEWSERPRHSPGKGPGLCDDFGEGGGRGLRAGVERRAGTRWPALSRALAAGTVLQWAIGALEYCFCCPGKAGTAARAHPPEFHSGGAAPRPPLSLQGPHRKEIVTPLARYRLDTSQENGSTRAVDPGALRASKLRHCGSFVSHSHRPLEPPAPLTGGPGRLGAGQSRDSRPREKTADPLKKQNTKSPPGGRGLPRTGLAGAGAGALAVRQICGAGRPGFRGVPGGPERRVGQAPAPTRPRSQTPLRLGRARGALGPFRPPRPLGLPGAQPPGRPGPARSPPPGPLRRAVPGPGRRTGSSARLASAPPGGRGGTSQRPSSLSPASLLPLSPLCTGAPRARRRPGGSRRPASPPPPREDGARAFWLPPVGARRTQPRGPSCSVPRFSSKDKNVNKAIF
ncbi:collagen alpha-1(I) chain-like [Prionailurus bengalensis]|uniref:collagen alpha-1(I) chain-like n=1 Tax=Prionailurus bengalensis TaxID=37029 RepID=UPI001CA7D59D|nr:collagen alpha-1(I) chain-like [Prionailurus bengalensis]